MQRIKNGDSITVEYEGKLDSGEIFETTKDTGALDFEVGSDAVLPAFEKAVLDMAENETRTVVLTPEEGYGERLPELTHTVDRQTLGTTTEPQPGMVFGLDIEHEGKPQKVPVMVTAVMGDQVTVDFNHPLAGQNLTYTITIKEIKHASADHDSGGPANG